MNWAISKLVTTTLLMVVGFTAGAEPDMVQIPFPGYPETRVIRTLKAKADRLYAEGRYGRAHRLYAKRLAFYGDKYSQYMAGFQYLHGQGVARDPAKALAWFRLAAQRREPALVRLRDELAGQLSVEERGASDAYYQEIDAVYGDQRILERLIFADLRELRSMTGSRIGATIAPLKILRPDGTVSDATSFYDDVELRMHIRVQTLQLLRGSVEYGKLTVIEPATGDETRTDRTPSETAPERDTLP